MTTIVTRAGKGSPLTNNEMDDNLTNLNTDKVETSVLANYALVASPTFTGDPKAPNPAFGDNDTSIATTSFVNNNAVTKTATTGGANIPVGTTAQRPTGSNGIFRYNTDLAIFEGYSGSDWGQVGGGGQTPAGAVMNFAMNAAPTGWLKANGALVSRTTYATLFSAIGTTFGVGDGSTTFGLPDLRGEFMRGWDDSRGIDVARAFGSAQADAFKSHVHSTLFNPTAGSAAAGSGLGQQSAYNTGATGDTETRPRNIALLTCIKY